MATARQVLTAISSQVQSVTSLAVPPLANGANLIAIQVAVGWPPLDAIQNIGNSNTCIISVYDSGKAKDNTRWFPNRAQEIISPTYITSTLSAGAVAAGATVTLTVGLIGGQTAPYLYDAISLVGNYGNSRGGTAYSSIAGDTTATIAIGLAALINSDPVLGQWLTATTAGSIISLHNKSTHAVDIQSYVGNIDNRQNEYSRINRRVQVILWCGFEAVREVVGAQIESLLGALRANFGVQMSDGTWTWINYDGDVLSEEETLKNVYRRDIYIDAEYSVTGAEQAWSVLVPIPAYATF